MAANFYKQTLLPTLSLFTSVGTLLCCALPALLVTLGMGAALAGMVSNLPWLIVISDYKIAVFTIAGILLIITGILLWQARNQACPVDSKQAKACMRLRKVNWYILIIASLIYLIGYFFAFIAPSLFYP